jgi:prepilin-type processing-associated H-X9-DG protein
LRRGPPLSLGEVVRPTETITVAEGATTSQTFIVMGERHGAGLNASFVDGHARWLPGEELFRIDTNGQGFYWFHYLSADR